MSESTPPSRESNVPPTAETPEPSASVRAARVRWDTIENMFVIAVTSVLFAVGKIDVYWWSGINGAVLGLVNLPKALGKGPQSIGMMLGSSSLAKKAIGAAMAAKHLS